MPFLFLYFWSEEGIFEGCLWFQRFLSQNCWMTLGPHRTHKLFNWGCTDWTEWGRLDLSAVWGWRPSKARERTHSGQLPPQGAVQKPEWCYMSLSWWEKARAHCAMQAEFVVTVLINQCQSIHAVRSRWLSCNHTASNGSTECACKRSHQAHYFSVPITFVIECQDWKHVFISSEFTWLSSWVSIEEGHEQHQHELGSQNKSVNIYEKINAHYFVLFDVTTGLTHKNSVEERQLFSCSRMANKSRATQPGPNSNHCRLFPVLLPNSEPPSSSLSHPPNICLDSKRKV